MIQLVQNNLDALKTICERYAVAELYLFGSAANDHYTENSDLDFAVVFKDTLTPIEKGDAFFSLYDALENLFQKNIDLVSYRVVKNPVFKEELDRTKIELYAAA